MDQLHYILMAVAVLLGAAGVFIGIAYRKNIGEKAIGSAEEKANRIIEEAKKKAEDIARAAHAKKKETLLEAKDEIHKNRVDFDKEVKERRSEISRQERRINQKEESLDKKAEAIDKKDEQLTRKNKELDNLKGEIEALKEKEIKQLEQISGMKREEAKEIILKEVESETKHDAAKMIKEITDSAKEEADAKAKWIVGLALQRCAADHAAEITVSVVNLPSDEMKGRIIGREGRNIRTLETLTGVDLIIDDTPEAVILSSFDPIRREIARIALERLIHDGRIHPARIEEMVEKARKEVENTIKQEGERATFETGVHGLHPELIKLLGKLHYRTSYGQNVLMHSIEVAHLSGVMASEMGVDVATAKRAGLLHDIGKSIDHEIDGSHVEIGANAARKYKEGHEVIHAIMAHHGDVEAETLIACIVQAADAISAARPGARRENIETYIKRLEKLEEIATSVDGVEKSYAIQAGREVRIMVKPEEVSDDSIVLLARDISKRIESELEYPGQIKINVIREVRAIEYAK